MTTDMAGAITNPVEKNSVKSCLNRSSARPLLPSSCPRA